MIVATDLVKKCALLLVFSSLTFAVVAQEEVVQVEATQEEVDAALLEDLSALMPENLEAANQVDDDFAGFGDLDIDAGLEDEEDMPFAVEASKEATVS